MVCIISLKIRTIEYVKMRGKSNYINMRKFHNRVKQDVIQRSVLEFKRRNRLNTVRVLDVSVGRFGDLHNYIRTGVDYVLGLDPDVESINEAENRLIKTDLDAELKVARITDRLIPELDGEKFDVACCHFSLHYFFESEEMLRNALENISNSLVKGGYFIGTTIVGEKVDRFIGNSEHYNIKKLYDEYNVGFGLGYKFKLIDNPDGGIYFNIHDEDTEYLVNMDLLNLCIHLLLQLVFQKLLNLG